MSPIEKWRELGIYNSSTLARKYAQENPGKPGVYLAWTPDGVGRIGMGQHAGYHVIRPGYKTDPDPSPSGYRDNGNKFFMRFANADSFEQDAKDWAGNRYRVPEWVRIPGFPRDWFPAELAAWAKAYLKDNA